jgi:hypothetical protein
MGVPITGTLTTYPNGQYPTNDALTALDGWRSVTDQPTRNLIPNYLRRQGMAVWTQSDGKLWILNPSPWAGTNADWTQFVSSAPTGNGTRIYAWGLGGGGSVLIAAADVGAFWPICTGAGTFTRVDLIAKSGPTGAAFIIDILKSSNSGSSFSTLFLTKPKPQIASGAVAGNVTAFDTTAFAQGDILRLDILQVGSTNSGNGITVDLTGTLS